MPACCTLKQGNRQLIAGWWCCLLLLLANPLQANVELVQFDDLQKQQLYQQMIRELRCLVCQNQNLADSNADLATDLRHRTRDLIEQGYDRQQIADYMVERYGEFVLYRPRLGTATLFLWFSPLALLFVVICLVIRSRRKRTVTEDAFTSEQLAEARRMLDDTGRPNHPQQSSSTNHTS